MQPVTRSMGPLRVLEELNPLQDIAELANQILSPIEALISLEAALPVINPVHISDPHGFPIELLDPLQSHAGGGSARQLRPTTFSDGFQIYPIPLVHAGSLESILCLRGSRAAVMNCLVSN